MTYTSKIDNGVLAISPLAETGADDVREGLKSSAASNLREELHPSLKKDYGYRTLTAKTRFVMPTREFENDVAVERHGGDSWKTKAVQFIHTKPVQFTLIALLLIDVIVLFIEMFISASFPSCSSVEEDGISCCPATEEQAVRWLSEATANDAHEQHNLCESPFLSTTYPVACDEHKYPGLHTAHVVLRAISISILTVFLVELSVLMIAIGVRHFFHKFYYVLDLFVISFSLILEILFVLTNNNQAADLAGLLIIARLWRFVRIGHGIFSSTAEVAKQQLEILVEYTSKCEQLLRDNGVDLPEGRPKLVTEED
jgi:hypothetical protein